MYSYSEIPGSAMGFVQRKFAAPPSQKDKNLTEIPWPNPSYAWYVTVILAVAYFVSFVDRMILQPDGGADRARPQYHRHGNKLAFGPEIRPFYATLGIPLARLADRTNRKAIISAGIFIWSFMTAFTGLARIGVGVGEATLNPSAYSMMADYFPKDKLGRAMGVYGLGGTVGIGGALMIGGGVVGQVEGMENLNLPVIGVMYPWQLTFFVVGLPGILLSALIFFTVKELVRRSAVRGKPVGVPVSLSDALGAGPTLVALITDYGFADPNRVGDSLAIVAGVSLPIAALLFWSGLRALRVSMEHLAAPETDTDIS